MRDRFIEELRSLISSTSSTVPEDSGV
jgi:hypothetical protein